jgi:hypothetical protein
VARRHVLVVPIPLYGYRRSGRGKQGGDSGVSGGTLESEHGIRGERIAAGGRGVGIGARRTMRHSSPSRRRIAAFTPQVISLVEHA